MPHSVELRIPCRMHRTTRSLCGKRICSSRKPFSPRRGIRCSPTVPYIRRHAELFSCKWFAPGRKHFDGQHRRRTFHCRKLIQARGRFRIDWSACMRRRRKLEANTSAKATKFRLNDARNFRQTLLHSHPKMKRSLPRTRTCGRSMKRCWWTSDTPRSTHRAGRSSPSFCSCCRAAWSFSSTHRSRRCMRRFCRTLHTARSSRKADPGGPFRWCNATRPCSTRSDHRRRISWFPFHNASSECRMGWSGSRPSCCSQSLSMEMAKKSVLNLNTSHILTLGVHVIVSWVFTLKQWHRVLLHSLITVLSRYESQSPCDLHDSSNVSAKKENN